MCLVSLSFLALPWSIFDADTVLEHFVIVSLYDGWYLMISQQTKRSYQSWAEGCLFPLTIMNHFGIVTRLRAWQSGVRILAGARFFVMFYKPSRPAFGPIQFSVKLVPGLKRTRREVVTHLRLASMFRMSGAVRLLPLWVFMAWAGTALRLATDTSSLYRGADKSLARPGSKQATATEALEFHISYL